MITEPVAHICLLIVILIVDAIVLYLARNEKDINNEYFKMHKKWGFAKSETAKLLAALFVIHELLAGGINRVSLMGIVIVYCLIVLQFILDYRSFKRKERTFLPD